MLISVEDRGRCRIIRFTRPHERNPLSIAVIDEMVTILNDVDPDDTDRLVFTGSADVFASGADLREIAALTSENAADFAESGQSLMSRIAGLPVETWAAINGYCFGGALDLSLACHRRIASPGSVFSHPGAGLGIITGWGGTQRLPRLIGQARAMEMLLTAGRFDAEWALLAGLVDEIADDPLALSLLPVDR